MDHAFVNGRIYTMETPTSTAEAFAVKDGRIAWIGDTTDCPQAKETTNLRGKVVLPGFVDGHMHFLHVGVKALRPDLLGATSRDACMERIRAWVQANPGEGSIIAEGWDEGLWEDKRHPTVAELDEVTNRPLVFRRVCGHISIANSAALPLIRAQWDDDRVNMETGLLLEEPSLYLNEVLPVDADTLDKAVEHACAEAHQLGVTAVGDYSQLPYRHSLLRCAEKGTLTVRTVSSIYTQDLRSEIQNGFRTGIKHSPFLQDGGVKVFLDGSLGGHTALLRDPYCDAEHRGTPIWSPEEIEDHFQTANRAGVQIHAHAIGDAAIDLGLDGFDTLSLEDKVALRHRFEHYELPHDDAVQRTANQKIWCCSQPNFVGEWSSKGGMYEERLGERYRINNRFREYLRRNVHLCFGSDGMPFGPLYGLQSAMDHPVSEERITIQEAVWLYTRAAALSLHWPDIGSLETGHEADFLVLDQTTLDDKPVDWKLREVRISGQTVSSAP